MSKIHVVGDSHVMLFTGQKNLPFLLEVPTNDTEANEYDLFTEFDTFFCVLLRAFYFQYPSERSQTDAAFNIIQQQPIGDNILIVTGEIDCRGPIVNLVRKDLSTLNDAVELCVERYMTGIARIKELGYNPIIWSPTPNQYAEEALQEGIKQHIGVPEDLSVDEWFDLKNQIVLKFDQLLKQTDYPIISFVDWIFQDGIQYDRSYWGDLIHLNEKCWSQIPVEFEKIGINITLEMNE